ncbi:MAG TPA: DNA repair protein RadC [Cellvibrio sp.]|nr:DNA repair protein RadC [Cellvibrio sp.]
MKELLCLPAHSLSSHISEDEIIDLAKKIVTKRFTRSNYLTSPDATREFLTLLLVSKPREHFLVVFLDNQHGVLCYESIFEGTIDGATVYPREVVKSVLNNNAAAIILAHNHPSGVAEPSQADRLITDRIVRALDTIDVRVLDHLIVGGTSTVSFAERGWI